jgi:prepilin-type N-terminal cleavage/methylation domain-containing protein
MKLSMKSCGNKLKQGFTLVELLIVISILGVLASIALVSFRSAQIRGRDAQRKNDLKQISSALELFYADYAKYPTATSTSPDACPYNASTQTGSLCTWGTGEFRDVDANGITKTTYFKVIPKDPVASFNYLYRVDATRQKFQIFAHIENTQDPSLITTSQTCGGANPCNFAVTSPNTTPSDF